MHETELMRPSWSCVHFVDEREAGRVLQLLAPGTKVVEIDASRIESDQDLFAALDYAFHFPEYFGKNWDALDECLRDLSWIPSKGYVLVVRGSEHLWRTAYRTAGRLLESWAFSAEEWS